MPATAGALSDHQLRRLRDDGYLVVPQAVAPDLVGRALRAINHGLSQGIDPAKLPTFHAQSFCPEVCGTPAIVDLFERSGARQVAESAMGPLQPVGGGQIALRWPLAPDLVPTKQPKAHIDGTYSPTNGVPPGKILNFTALASVLLSDLATTDAGNFMVWPGSHLVHERYFREHGPEALLAAPKLDLGQPVQVTGRAGDLVLAHYLLGHTAALNLSPHVRYAVFFRLHGVGFTDENRLGAVTDAWRDWPGIRALAGG